MDLSFSRGTGVTTAQRYVQFAGQAVAMRTGMNADTVHTLWSEVNNTAAWQVRNTDSAVTIRRSLPFGAPRGPNVQSHFQPGTGAVPRAQRLDGGSSGLSLRFCPFCGWLLPPSLRDDWFDRLKAFGLEPKDPGVPVEMRSEVWWDAEQWGEAAVTLRRDSALIHR